MRLVAAGTKGELGQPDRPHSNAADWPVERPCRDQAASQAAHLGAELLEVLGQALVPQHCQVGLGRGAQVVQGVQHAEGRLGHHGLARLVAAAQHAGHPGRVAGKQVVVLGRAQLPAGQGQGGNEASSGSTAEKSAKVLWVELLWETGCSVATHLPPCQKGASTCSLLLLKPNTAQAAASHPPPTTASRRRT